MMKWLSERSLIGTYLIGIYFSLLPMCYSLVKIFESGFQNEFITLYLALCSMIAPTFFLQYMRTIALQKYKKEDKVF